MPDLLPMTDDEARRRVAKEKRFYGGLGMYAAVIVGLAVLNVLTSPDHLWFLYPATGWGLALAVQAVELFGLPGMKGWEARRLGELTGQGVSEARLRQVLDETLDERAVPAGAPQTAERLQRRIEHLEAIVTSRDWETAASLPDSAPLSGAFDALADEETAAEQAARLARRVR
ncbi:MAG TPA: 2TM domain-containing protein [Rubricoccaceae bacterium]